MAGVIRGVSRVSVVRVGAVQSAARAHRHGGLQGQPLSRRPVRSLPLVDLCFLFAASSSVAHATATVSLFGMCGSCVFGRS